MEEHNSTKSDKSWRNNNFSFRSKYDFATKTKTKKIGQEERKWFVRMELKIWSSPNEKLRRNVNNQAWLKCGELSRDIKSFQLSLNPTLFLIISSRFFRKRETHRFIIAILDRLFILNIINWPVFQIQNFDKCI